MVIWSLIPLGLKQWLLLFLISLSLFSFCHMSHALTRAISLSFTHTHSLTLTHKHSHTHFPFLCMSQTRLSLSHFLWSITPSILWAGFMTDPSKDEETSSQIWRHVDIPIPNILHLVLLFVVKILSKLLSGWKCSHLETNLLAWGNLPLCREI